MSNLVYKFLTIYLLQQFSNLFYQIFKFGKVSCLALAVALQKLNTYCFHFTFIDDFVRVICIEQRVRRLCCLCLLALWVVVQDLLNYIHIIISDIIKYCHHCQYSPMTTFLMGLEMLQMSSKPISLENCIFQIVHNYQI